jgi:hypothetical protein
MDDIAKVYSDAQNGGELPYFVGKQYGAGWLRTLARLAFPILKRLVGVASNTAEDVIVHEKGLVGSLKDNSMKELGRFMTGKGMYPRNSSINISRKRKRKSNEFDGTIFEPLTKRK